MIAASGLLLLSQGELSLSPANKSASDWYIDSAIQVRLLFPLYPYLYLSVYSTVMRIHEGEEN